MRDITGIVIHCSATKETADTTVEDIKRGHLKRGFSDIGYHYYITKDGIVHAGRMIDRVGAHVKGYNSNTIGICYEGGYDTDMKIKDTRTDNQIQSMNILILHLLNMFPGASIKGHRDYSKDLDGDGIIEKHEWMKSCPCFDVESEYGDLR